MWTTFQSVGTNELNIVGPAKVRKQLSEAISICLQYHLLSIFETITKDVKISIKYESCQALHI